MILRMNSIISKLYIVVILSCISNTISAQSVAEQWINIPDKFVPYITINQKKEMIESYKIHIDSSVKNKFEGTTKIDTLTNEYGKFILSDARDIELLRLPTDNDSILCVIDTYKGSASQSVIRFFDKQWTEITSEGKIQLYKIVDFLHKPDTMSIGEYRELREMLVPELIEYGYDISTNSLIVSPSLPLLTTDDRNRINRIISKKLLKWHGAMFK